MNDSRTLIEGATQLYIARSQTLDYDSQDLVNLCESYRLIEEAHQSFMAGEVSFSEFIELIEMHEVNVDSYLESVEENLTILNLI